MQDDDPCDVRVFGLQVMFWQEEVNKAMGAFDGCLEANKHWIGGLVGRYRGMVGS